MINRMALTMPMIRTGKANCLGTLTRSSAVPHRVIPAANDGMLLSGSAALESKRPSPIANTRKPPATMSFPSTKAFYCKQRGCHHQPGTVDCPQNRLQRWRDRCSSDAATMLGFRTTADHSCVTSRSASYDNRHRICERLSLATMATSASE
jgi:hypothetical protein